MTGHVSGRVSDTQIASFLTSACIYGLSGAETAYLTFAMKDSGSQLSFRYLGKPVVDKHSTGGLGDKVSIVLVPILMSFPVVAPMISGRGLGHTGGTIDKLESVSGFRALLSFEEMHKLAAEQGAFIASQSAEIAPADKAFYAIRDVTGNIDSPGLIAASILSKKLSEGLNCLALDVKVGRGAFMKTLDQAQDLVFFFKQVMRETSVKLKVFFTAMDVPLGYAVGNFPEILECESALSGEFPEDLKEITYDIAANLLSVAGVQPNRTEAMREINKKVLSGEALNNFYKLLSAQGGSLEVSKTQFESVPRHTVVAPHGGYVRDLDAFLVGLGALELGCGRFREDDPIDPFGGIKLLAKPGDFIHEGEPLAEISGVRVSEFPQVEMRILSAYKFTDEFVTPNKVVIDRFDSN